MLDLAEAVKLLDVQVDIVPRLYETIGPNATIHTIEGLPLLGLPPARPAVVAGDEARDRCRRGHRRPPRALADPRGHRDRDQVGLKGPALYRHERLGRFGVPFRLFKFRSMDLANCRGIAYGGETEGGSSGA